MVLDMVVMDLDMVTLVAILDMDLGMACMDPGMDLARVVTEAGMAAASALVTNNINEQSVKDLMIFKNLHAFFLSKHFYCFFVSVGVKCFSKETFLCSRIYNIILNFQTKII